MSGLSDMGDDIHELVHAFADGELEPAEAEAFREHLGTCEQCQAELDDILQLQALSGRLASTEAKQAPAPVQAARTAEAARPTEPARPAEPPRPSEAAPERTFRPAWSRRRRAGLTVVLGGALAAAFALAVLRNPGVGSEGMGHEALALAPTRSMEARLSYAGASGWRPYGVKRGNNERALEMVPLETQAKLEKAGDLHGLATSYLLRGERDSAAEYLSKLSGSPDVDSDRAVVALSKGALEEALTLLDGVLEKSPNHAPALWNRGLVLRELGLELLAAESFGKVAALNEPGWSGEARNLKASLERQGLERQNRWKAVHSAGKAMVEQGKLLNESQVRDAPSMARRSLYLAAWTAPSAERVRALLPVAKALDAHYGGDVLQAYVERTAQRDFSQRGPLAATFAQGLAGTLEPSAAEGFIRQLQAAGEQDMLLGALPLLHLLPARMELYATAARSVGDSWFLMGLEAYRARQQLAASQLSQMEATLTAALPTCEQQGLDARCAELYQLRAELFVAQHRLPEAREQALRGLKWAQQVNDAGVEMQLLRSLGQIARQRDGLALMRAYFQEAALREQQFCNTQADVHEAPTPGNGFEPRARDARFELEGAPMCGVP
ncbi:MAG: zf-HC2 domain-containing protein [Hyalangium sp.]|uniref:zf-HC2 domain-containing protein n=1 Tax=Hyalangium sp. TaxID=2028555 RepID=UPI003899E6E1